MPNLIFSNYRQERYVFYDVHINGQNVAYCKVEQRTGYVFIHDLYVLNKFRGQGIGKSLGRQVLACYADQLIQIKAESHGRIESIELQKLYTRYGFRHLGYGNMYRPRDGT